MDVLIHPCRGLKGSLRAQPSKNYTTRYLLVSALAGGESQVRYPAKSQDAGALISCLKELGAEIVEQEERCIVRGFGSHPRNPGVLNPGNAGAVLRFLLGVASILPEVKFVTDYPDSLGKRPNQDLLMALEQLGVKTKSNEGRLPITLRGSGLHGGKVTVSGEKSSQYLSALLFLSPLIKEKVEIRVTGNLKSRPAVRTTLEVLEEAGITVKASSDLLHFHVPGGQKYRAGSYEVHGDWPGSAALLAAAAVCPESDLTITGLYPDEQGEQAITDVLRDMGARVEEDEGGINVRGGDILTGVEFNGDLATDAALAMVGAACFARGQSRFFNVENLRFKECDRISEPLSELCRMGVESEEKRDEIIIHGNPDGYQGDVTLDGRGDHRVIMLLTILGLGSKKGVRIKGAEHVAKSYPDFFYHLEKTGANIEFRGKGDKIS